MQYDLIALDLDGTALAPGGTVTPGVREAIAWARARGVRVVVATGRICGEAAEFARLLGADDLMVTAGGAALADARQCRCTYRETIGWEDAVRAAAAVERIGLIAMIYMGERLLVTPYDEAAFGRYKTNEGYLESKQVVPSVAEFIARERLPIDKIFCRSHQPEMLAFARRQLTGTGGIRVMRSAEDNIEILSAAADKGRALGVLAGQLGTSLDRCIAIGDSENDLEMLRAVGMPVAMANAAPEVHALARFTTRSNAEDGVAHAIYTLLGREEG